MNDSSTAPQDSNLEIAKSILETHTRGVAEAWDWQVRQDLLLQVTELLESGWLRISLELPHRLGLQVVEDDDPADVLAELCLRIADAKRNGPPPPPPVSDARNPWGISLTKSVRHPACGRSDCTGGGSSPGTGSGKWRCRIDADTGEATRYCDTAVIDLDGLMVTCHTGEASGFVERPLPRPPVFAVAPRIPGSAGLGLDLADTARTRPIVASAVGFCDRCHERNVRIPGLAGPKGLCNTCRNVTMEEETPS